MFSFICPTSANSNFRHILGCQTFVVQIWLLCHNFEKENGMKWAKNNDFKRFYNVILAAEI